MYSFSARSTEISLNRHSFLTERTHRSNERVQLFQALAFYAIRAPAPTRALSKPERPQKLTNGNVFPPRSARNGPVPAPRRSGRGSYATARQMTAVLTRTSLAGSKAGGIREAQDMLEFEARAHAYYGLGVKCDSAESFF
jgi:hypothetical protein